MKRPAAKTKPARKEKKGDENEGSEDFEENEEPPTPEEPAGVAKAKAKPKEKSKAKAKAKGKAKAKATEKPGVEVFGFDLVLDHRKFLQTTGNVVEYWRMYMMYINVMYTIVYIFFEREREIHTNI